MTSKCLGCYYYTLDPVCYSWRPYCNLRDEYLPSKEVKYLEETVVDDFEGCNSFRPRPLEEKAK